ncbi:hypothetical protein [Aurantiacibacter aquimixticola]|uniref:hypothetical protein n=1 Tax=Aurantiacibacter aquimixticola TaxID=1958945 RepID=UPI001058D981|nr:hypothetical protein [Aurantiacibacter aquimixticola]
MTDSTPSTFSLSASEISHWREECAEIDRKIEQLRKKKGDIEERLSAAQLLAPSLFVASEPEKGKGRGQAKMRKGLMTWPHIIEEAVRNSETGLRQRDLLESIRSGRHGKRLTESESAYYNAIQKVLKRKIVIKRGEWLFTPAQHDEYLRKVDAGEVKDVAEVEEYGSPSAAEAVRFVTASPGRKSIDVIKHIWATQDADKKQRQSKTSLYNVLARLVEQQKLSKDDEGLFYPFNENEAPSDEPTGASETGEVAASSSDTSPLFRVVK